MSENPWKGLSPPDSSSAITAKRVNEAIPWNLFWAVDHDRRYLLVLRYSADSAPRNKLPDLRELELRSELLPTGEPVLVLRLLDPSMRDVFLQLCLDIAGAIAGKDTEAAAVEAAVARTWRWHHLLRGGSSGRLRPNDQKGLIAELLVLERYLIPCLGPAQAVAAWRGPLHAARDFVARSTSIESKARSSAEAGTVPISSEFQLWVQHADHVYLHLSVLDIAENGDEGAFSLSDVVVRAKARLDTAGDAAVGRFEALLAAAGFDIADDYSNDLWAGGERSIYRVIDGFPAITAPMLPAGVAMVQYEVTLTAAAAFIVSPAQLREELNGDI